MISVEVIKEERPEYLNWGIIICIMSALDASLFDVFGDQEPAENVKTSHKR